MYDIKRARDFLEGLDLRDSELVKKQVNADKYIEHSPYVADGAAGLSAYIASLPQENSKLQVVRVLQDGVFVVTQCRESVLNQQDFFDVFRFESGLIVEHWHFSQPVGPPNKSGHTQVDGPTEPTDLADTDKNKKLVQEYYEIVHLSGQHDKVHDFVSQEHVTAHEPGGTDGIEAFKHLLESVQGTRSIDEIAILLGQGDLVCIVAKGTHQTEPCVYVDLYRVKNGKIVEHWGFPQSIPPQQERKNSNGIV